MKNLKKLFSVVATLLIVSTIVPVSTLGASYSDELEGAYDYAYGIGITTQGSIDSANLYGQLIRSHMAKMMVNYAKEVLGKTSDETRTCTFTDISSESEEMKGFIVEACKLGLMGLNSDGTSATMFNPNGVITRAQFGTVLSRALWGDANNGSDPYYANHLSALKDAGVMSKIDTPDAQEVRGYVMLMMQRADEGNVATESKPAVCSTPENVLACSLSLDSCPAECKTTEVKPGSATISLVGSESTQSVPKNAKSVKVGTVKLTAGENDTTVSSLVITRSGLGNASEVSSLQMFLTNGVAATVASSRMSTSTQTSTLRFSPSLVLKAGSSINLDLIVGLSGAENNEHTFAVSTVNVANGSASGTPVTVGTLKTTSYNAGTVTLANFIAYSIVAGKKDQTIATLDLTPNAKDGIVKGFTIEKTAGEDFDKAIEDVKAYYNGNVIGDVVVTNEKITVSNLNIERMNGETANIELKADGIYVGAASTITGQIAANDVIVVEKASGFSMACSNTLTDDFQLTNLDIVLTKVTTGSVTVAPGKSGVELFNARVTSNATFDVSSYTLEFTQGSGALASGFVDGIVTAYINGVDYELNTGINNFTASADKFMVEPGQAVVIRVVGNVKSTATTGTTYQMKLTLKQAKNIDNGQTATLSNSLDGDTVVVNNGGYTITKPTSIPSNKTVLEGSNSDVLYFNLRANAENQVLKELTIGSSTGFSTYATKVALMQGNTEVKAFTNSTDLSGTALTFDNLSTSLIKDTTTPFTVRVTLKAGEVENLGTSIVVAIANTKVVRSVNQTMVVTTSSSVVTGNAYQISSSVPTVALPTQDGKNTVIALASTSSYDVEVISGSMEMTRNLNNGTYVNWSGSVKILDSINGTSAGTVVGNAPGAITFTFLGSGLVVDTASAERVIELVDPANTVTSDDYTVNVKNLTFRYVDRNDGAKSAVITESYNVSK